MLCSLIINLIPFQIQCPKCLNENLRKRNANSMDITSFFCKSIAKCSHPNASIRFLPRSIAVKVYRSSSRSSANLRRWFTWFCFKPLDRHSIAGGLREFPWRLRVVNVWKKFLLKEYSTKAEIQATLFICNAFARCSIPDWLIEFRARFNVVNV